MPWAFYGADPVFRAPRRSARHIADSADALRTAALAGLGIVNLPHVLVAEDMEAGNLTAVLGDFAPGPIPVHYSSSGPPTPLGARAPAHRPDQRAAGAMNSDVPVRRAVASRLSPEVQIAQRKCSERHWGAPGQSQDRVGRSVLGISADNLIEM